MSQCLAQAVSLSEFPNSPTRAECGNLACPVAEPRPLAEMRLYQRGVCAV